MSGESLDVKLARMDEQMKTVRESVDLARDSRKQQYEMIERINQVLIKMDGRLDGVEKSLAKATPTIDEFVNIKLKVQGAGMAGKAAWAVGVTIISVLFSFREYIFNWFSKL